MRQPPGPYSLLQVAKNSTYLWWEGRGGGIFKLPYKFAGTRQMHTRQSHYRRSLVTPVNRTQ